CARSTLEWAAASPPPAHNFDATPVVDGLTPLWKGQGVLPVMEGLATDRRQVLVTSVVQARPEYRQKSPEPSIAPLLAAFAVSAMFVGSIFTPWAIAVGAIPVAIALTAWFWPQRSRSRTGPLRVRESWVKACATKWSGIWRICPKARRERTTWSGGATSASWPSRG